MFDVVAANWLKQLLCKTLWCVAPYAHGDDRSFVFGLFRIGFQKMRMYCLQLCSVRRFVASMVDLCSLGFSLWFGSRNSIAIVNSVVIGQRQFLKLSTFR